jgi:hypothetical protein
MNSADTDYYRARASEEREAAKRSSRNYIAEIHLELAESYEALAEQPELRSGLKVVSA